VKELTAAERQALRGRAHRLHPVVLIGADGLTPAVLAEADRALTAHELIKLRVMGEDRGARERLLAEVCAAVDAAPVQHIGRVLVIYRERPQNEPQKPQPARLPRSRRLPEQRAQASRPARTPNPRRGKFRPR